ncbi:MAG: hypothetical protein ACTSXK_11370 [Promethearchaeota archaeon]
MSIISVVDAYTLIPWAILGCMFFFSVAFQKPVKKARFITIIGLTLLLAYDGYRIYQYIITEFPETSSSGLIGSASTIISEFFLLLLTFIYLSASRWMKNSHNSGLISPIFILFITAMYGLFQTMNLIYLTIFIALLTISNDVLFFFGSRKLPAGIQLGHSIIKYICFTLLIFADIWIFRVFNSFDLTTMLTKFGTLGANTQIGIISCYSIGFFGLLGIIPFGYTRMTNYFGQSNLFHNQIYLTIYLPVLSYLLITILFPLFGYFAMAKHIIIIWAGIGIITYGVNLILELYGKTREKGGNILRIFGIFGLLSLHSLLLIISLRFLSVSPEISTYHNVFIYFIALQSLGMFFLYQSMIPIFDQTENRTTWRLDELHGYRALYPGFIFLALIGLCFFICPGFPGYNILSQLLPDFIISDPNTPFYTYEIWAGLVLFIFYLVCGVIFVGTLLNEVFFGYKKTKNQLKNQSETHLENKAQKISYSTWYFITPMLLIALSIAIIFALAHFSNFQIFFY